MLIQLAGSALSKLGRIPRNAEYSYQYLLIRLLLGTASVSRGSISCKQQIDYSSLPSVAQTKSPAIAAKDFLTSYAVGGSIERLIRVTRADNREFYKEILSEFLNYQVQIAQGRNTAAFVFLYRMLERVCYSVPLLYASTQTDYVGTFNDLKAILNATDAGELGLFKKFLSQGRFIDPIKLQVVQQITFSSTGGHQASYYNLTVTRFTKFTSTDPVTNQVEVKFVDIPELLITIRNRFFHSRTGDGRSNITTIEMTDSDEYFGNLNPLVMSFLAIVVLHTIAIKYQV
jgi:hypothetical protein